MKELKKIFTEIRHAYKTTWSRKKHFISIATLLLVLSILPKAVLMLTVFLYEVGVLGGATVNMLLLVPYLSLVLATFIAVLIATVGLVASIRSILAHTHEPLKKILAKGTKKILPVFGLEIVTIIPLVTFTAAAIYFELGLFGSILIFIGVIWLVLTCFSKFFLLFENNTIYSSLHKGIAFLIKNTVDVVLRFLAIFATIFVPLAVVVTFIELIYVYIIKFMFEIPTFQLTLEAINQQMLPPSGLLIGTVFSILTAIIGLYIFLPLILTYLVKTFDDFKEKTNASKKLEVGIEKMAIAVYSLTALLSLAIFVKTIL